MRTRLTSLTLGAVLLFAVAQLLWRHQAAERVRTARYRPYRLHGVPTPAERRHRAAAAAAARIDAASLALARTVAVGRASVVYSGRLTDRPSIAATAASWWTADAAAA